jgi:uncharacterized protein YsxB (DUF464 family)
MTRIVYEPEQFRLSLEGHAGFGGAEKDLICAALSALWMGLERVMTADRVTVRRYRPVIIYGDGIRRMECSPDEECERECRAALCTIAAGMHWMAEQYPDFVSFEMQ